MLKYLLLRSPGHNRVYYLESVNLALAELTLACNAFQQACQQIETVDIAGIQYLSFTVEEDLSEAELQLLSALSFVFALFQQVDKTSLKPVALIPPDHLDPKISMLLKYSGKTNELFTRMMINVALLSSDFTSDANIQLLDPVAGRGTTLFEGTTYGFDVTGIEVDRSAVQGGTLFFKKYLEQEKYKHTLTKRKMYSNQEGAAAYIQDFEYARDKTVFKDETQRRRLGMIAGNALHARRYFKAEKFHLIVGDLPYGIAHGNKSQQKHHSLTRSPEELMKAILPDLFKVLKPGGSLVLAWNKFVWPREAFTQLLGTAGFEVLESPPYDQFTHRVDQSIKRDIVVARKP